MDDGSIAERFASFGFVSVVLDRPVFRLRLYSVDDVSLFQQFHFLAVLRVGRVATVGASLEDLELGGGSLEPSDFRRSLYRLQHGDRPFARHFSGSEDPYRGGIASDLPVSDGA